MANGTTVADLWNPDEMSASGLVNGEIFYYLEETPLSTDIGEIKLASKPYKFGCFRQLGSAVRAARNHIREAQVGVRIRVGKYGCN